MGGDCIGKRYVQTETHTKSTEDRGDKSEIKKERSDKEGRVQRGEETANWQV